jgi:hypothetical protein
MAGAVRCAGTVAPGEGATIVVISADDGWKYLSSDAWSGDLDEVTERASQTIYF